MDSLLNDDGLGAFGLSAHTFASRYRLRVGFVVSLCIRGCILGSRKHPLTHQWWIYPPAKLIAR